jgi:DNA-binding beta-propeller fold protein YncE
VRRRALLLLTVAVALAALAVAEPGTSAGWGELSPRHERFLDEAIEYFGKAHPEFHVDRSRSYAGETRQRTAQFAFLFDARDKGLGYEVHREGGKLSDSYDGRLFAKRLELIAYLNQLMPENRQFNEYVGFSPFGSGRAKVQVGGGINDGRVEYVVVSPRIDVRRQIGIDYLVARKANEILRELGEPSNGVWVQYFEGGMDLEAALAGNPRVGGWALANLERSGVATTFLRDLVPLRRVGDYRIENARGAAGERFLRSAEEYAAHVKQELARYGKSAKEENARLLEALETEGDRRAAAAAERERLGKLKEGERYTLLWKKAGPTPFEYRGIRFNPDGREVACVSGHGQRISVLDAATGRVRFDFKGDTSWLGRLSSRPWLFDGVMTVEFGPDGNRLVEGNFNNSLTVWDLRTGKRLWRIGGHRSKVHVAAFTPDGARIVSAAEDTRLKVWEAGSGRELKSVGQNQQYTMAFSPDGKEMVFGNEVYDTATWEVVRTLAGVRGVRAFSPDGRLVAGHVSPDTETIALADPARGNVVRKLAAHRSPVVDVSFHPAGRYLASAASDQTVKIWDLETGQVVNSLELFGSGSANAARYSPDGRMLAVSWSNLIALYRVE